MNKDKIIRIATWFREELNLFATDDRIDQSKYWNGEPPQFPDSWCKQASFLLAYFLVENFELEGLSYVNGWIGNDVCHGWLHYRGLFVDITTDQFTKLVHTGSVIVKHKENAQFHSQFKHWQYHEVPEMGSQPLIDLLYSDIMKFSSPRISNIRL